LKKNHDVYRLAAYRGALDMLPLSLAVLPWGILFGSLAVQRGFSALEAQAFSAIAFGGTVQIVAVELIADNASLSTILFSALVITSRHFLYGLRLRERLKNQPLRWRLSLGLLLTDELFALSGHRHAYKNRLRLYYALGAGGSFYIAWNVWTFIGIVAGTSLPDLTHLGLDFAIAATFIALIVPTIKTWSVLVTVIVAGIASVTFSLWQLETGLIMAGLLAMTAGFAVNGWERRQ
jgi:4-azaleucine resistance transporter AzlC